MTEPDPAVTAATELTDSFRAMTAQMKRLTRTGKLNRRLITGLVISFAVDLAVTGGLAYTTVRQNSVQDGIRASDITQCRLANVSRQQDIAIWNRLLAIPPAAAKAETAAQRAEVADLERLVRVKDAPRDCNAAFGK